MRTTCPNCKKCYDISNREVLAMAAKLQAKKGLPVDPTDDRPFTNTTRRAPSAPSLSPVADGNVRADNAALEGESVALRFLGDAKPPIKPV